MRERYVLAGNWFLPDDSKNVISGRLQFDPADGATLELDGVFSDKALTGDVNLPIVLGVTTTGKYVTLLNAFYTKVSLHLPVGPVSVIQGSRVLIGAHFADERSIRFESAVFRFHNLKEWLGISTLTYATPSLKTLQVETSAIDSQRFIIDEHLEGQFEFWCQYATAPPPMFEITLRHESTVRFTYKNVVPLDEIMDMSWHFQNLLSLAVGVPCPPIAMSCCLSSSEHPTAPPIDVHYAAVGPSPRDRQPVGPRYMLFSYPTVAKRFEDIVQRWYKSTAELLPVHHLFFGVSENPSSTIQSRFIDLARACESLHRFRLSNEMLPAAEHEKRITEILKTIPSTYSKWLKERLTHSNEPSLGKRLRELCSKKKGCKKALLEKMKISRSGCDKVIQQIVEHRNGLSHGTKTITVQDLLDMRGLCLFLQLLLTIWLLDELGFEDAEIETLIRSSRSR